MLPNGCYWKNSVLWIFTFQLLYKIPLPSDYLTISFDWTDKMPHQFWSYFVIVLQILLYKGRFADSHGELCLHWHYRCLMIRCQDDRVVMPFADIIASVAFAVRSQEPHWKIASPCWRFGIVRAEMFMGCKTGRPTCRFSRWFMVEDFRYLAQHVSWTVDANVVLDNGRISVWFGAGVQDLRDSQVTTTSWMVVAAT